MTKFKFTRQSDAKTVQMLTLLPGKKILAANEKDIADDIYGNHDREQLLKVSRLAARLRSLGWRVHSKRHRKGLGPWYCNEDFIDQGQYYWIDSDDFDTVQVAFSGPKPLIPTLTASSPVKEDVENHIVSETRWKARIVYELHSVV